MNGDANVKAWWAQVGATTVMPIQIARIKMMAGLHPAISAFEGLQKSKIEKTDSNQHKDCQKLPLLKIVLNSVEAWLPMPVIVGALKIIEIKSGRNRCVNP